MHNTQSHQNHPFSAVPPARGRERSHTLRSALAATALALILLYGSALAGASALHDVAHDARHGLAAPCH